MGKFFTKFKSLYLLVLTMVILSVGFTGCFESDDDEKASGKVVVSVILSDNTKVGDAIVSLAGQTGTTNADGKVTFDAIEEGNYSLNVAGKDNAYKSATTAVSVKGKETSVVVTLTKITTNVVEKGVVTVNVVDTAGKALVNAEVRIGNNVIGKTGQDGSIKTAELAYGTYAVDVVLATGTTANKSVQVNAATITATFTFASNTNTTVSTKDDYSYCSPKGTVAGQVVDQYGNPVADAMVSFGYGVIKTDAGGGFKMELLDVGGAGSGGAGNQDNNSGANDHTALNYPVTVAKTNYASWTLNAVFKDDTLVNDDVVAEIDLTKVTTLDLTTDKAQLGGTVNIPLHNSTATVKVVMYQLVTMKGSVKLPETVTGDVKTVLTFTTDIKDDTTSASSKDKHMDFERTFSSLNFEVPNLILVNTVSKLKAKVYVNGQDYATYYLSNEQEHDLAVLPTFSLESYAKNGLNTKDNPCDPVTGQCIVDIGAKTAYKYYTLTGNVYKDFNKAAKIGAGAVVKLDSRKNLSSATDGRDAAPGTVPADRMAATDAAGKYLITEILPGTYKIALFDFDANGDTIPEYINGKNYLNATIGYGKTDDIFQQGAAGASTGYVLSRDMWFEGAYNYSISGRVEAGLLGDTYEGMEVKVYSVVGAVTPKLEAQTVTAADGTFTLTGITNKNVYVTVEKRDIDGNGVANFNGIEEIGLAAVSLIDTDSWTEYVSNTDDKDVSDVRLFMPANVSPVATAEPNYLLHVKSTNYTQVIGNRLSTKVNSLEPDANIEVTFNVPVAQESIDEIVAAREPLAWLVVRGTSTTLASVITLVDNNTKMVIDPDMLVKDDNLSIKMNTRLKPAKVGASKASGYKYGSEFILNTYYLSDLNPKYTNFATGELYVDINTEAYKLNVVATNMTKKNEYGKFVLLNDNKEFQVNITDVDTIELTFDKPVYMEGKTAQEFWQDKVYFGAHDTKDNAKARSGSFGTPTDPSFKYNNNIAATYTYDAATSKLTMTPKLGSVHFDADGGWSHCWKDYWLSFYIDAKVYPENALKFYQVTNTIGKVDTVDAGNNPFGGVIAKVNIAKHRNLLDDSLYSSTWDNGADNFGYWTAKSPITPDGNLVIKFTKTIQDIQVNWKDGDNGPLSGALNIYYGATKLDKKFFTFTYDNAKNTATLIPNINLLKQNGQWFNDGSGKQVIVKLDNWIKAQQNEVPFNRNLQSSLGEVRFNVDLTQYQLNIVSGNFFEKDMYGQFRYFRNLEKNEPLKIKFDKPVAQGSLDYIVSKGLQAVYVADTERSVATLAGSGTSGTNTGANFISVNIRSVTIDPTDNTQLVVTLERDAMQFKDEHKYYVAVNTLLMSEVGFNYMVQMNRYTGGYSVANAGHSILVNAAGHPTTDAGVTLLRNANGSILDTKSFILPRVVGGAAVYDIPAPVPAGIWEDLETIAIVPIDKADMIFKANTVPVVVKAVKPYGELLVDGVKYGNNFDVVTTFPHATFTNFVMDWDLKKAGFFTTADMMDQDKPKKFDGTDGTTDFSGANTIAIRVPIVTTEGAVNFIGNDIKKGLNEYVVYAKYSKIDAVTGNLVAINDWKVIKRVDAAGISNADRLKGFTTTTISLSDARGLVPAEGLAYKGQIDITIVPVAAFDNQFAALPKDDAAERAALVLTIADNYKPAITKLNDTALASNAPDLKWTTNKIEISEPVKDTATLAVTGLNPFWTAAPKYVTANGQVISFDLVANATFNVTGIVTSGAMKVVPMTSTKGLFVGMVLVDSEGKKAEIKRITSDTQVVADLEAGMALGAGATLTIYADVTNNIWDRKDYNGGDVALTSAARKPLIVIPASPMQITDEITTASAMGTTTKGTIATADDTIVYTNIPVRSYAAGPDGILGTADDTMITNVPFLGFTTGEAINFHVDAIPSDGILSRVFVNGITANVGNNDYIKFDEAIGAELKAPLAQFAPTNVLPLKKDRVTIEAINILPQTAFSVNVAENTNASAFISAINDNTNVKIFKINDPAASRKTVQAYLNQAPGNIFITDTLDMMTSSEVTTYSNTEAAYIAGYSAPTFTGTWAIDVGAVTDIAGGAAENVIEIDADAVSKLFEDATGIPDIVYVCDTEDDNKLYRLTAASDNNAGTVTVTDASLDHTALKALAGWAAGTPTVDRFHIVLPAYKLDRTYQLTLDNTTFKVPLFSKKGQNLVFTYQNDNLPAVIGTDYTYENTINNVALNISVTDILDAGSSGALGNNTMMVTDSLAAATQMFNVFTAVTANNADKLIWVEDKTINVTIAEKSPAVGPLKANTQIKIVEDIADAAPFNSPFYNIGLDAATTDGWYVNQTIQQDIALTITHIGYVDMTLASYDADLPTRWVVDNSKYAGPAIGREVFVSGVSNTNVFELNTGFDVVTQTKPQIVFDGANSDLANSEALKYIDLAGNINYVGGTAQAIIDSYVLAEDVKIAIATPANAAAFAGRNLDFGVAANQLVITDKAPDFAVGDTLLGNLDQNPFPAVNTNLTGVITKIETINYMDGTADQIRYKLTLDNNNPALFSLTAADKKAYYKETAEFKITAVDTSDNAIQADDDTVFFDLEGRFESGTSKWRTK